MEIIEEEAFLSWKEDVNQEYPGKGKALFQVILCPLFFFVCTVFNSFLTTTGRFTHLHVHKYPVFKSIPNMCM